MSIRNLTTDNSKPDQNLNVNSVNAVQMDVTGNILVSGTLEAGILQSDLFTNVGSNLNVGNTLTVTGDSFLNGIVYAGDQLAVTGSAGFSDTLTVDGTTSLNVVTIGGNLSFGASGYVDVPLYDSALFTADITWTIYGTSSATIVDGIQIYKLGPACIVNFAPFDITGVTALPLENVITSDVVIPALFNPIADGSNLGPNRLNLNGAFAGYCAIFPGAGNYTFEIRQFDGSDFPIGAFSFGIPEPQFFTYFAAF